MAAINAEGNIDIDIWTERTIESLSTLAISSATTTPRGPRGTTVTLDIPLDVEHPAKQEHQDEDPALSTGAALRASYVRRKAPIRRDSMNRREALLKGKEGSRQRRKWENGKLARYVQ